MRFTGAMAAAGIGLFVATHLPAVGVGVDAIPNPADLVDHWADLEFMAGALRDGELPLWNPYERGGYDFTASGDSLAFDPLSALVAVIGAVIGGVPLGLVIAKIAVAYGLAAAGIGGFLRARRLPGWAAAVGALAYVQSPWLAGLAGTSGLWPAAFIGWALWAVDRMIRSPSPSAGIAAAAAVAGLLVTGDPALGVRLLPIVVVYAAVAFARTAAAAEDRSRHRRAVGVAIGVAAVVFAAVAIGPLWVMARDVTGDPTLAPSTAALLDSPVRPLDALALIAPPAQSGGLPAYVGLALGIGAVVGMVVRPAPEAIAIALVAAAGFTLACGDNSAVLPVVATWPGFERLPDPRGYLGLWTVGVVVLGPVGLSAIQTPTGASPWHRGGLAVVVVVAAAVTHGVAAHTGFGWPIAVVVALAIGATAWVPAKQATAAGWAVVAVTVLDVGLASRPIATSMQAPPDARKLAAVRKTVGDDPVYRIADFGWLHARGGTRLGVRDLGLGRADPPWSSANRDATRLGKLLSKARDNAEVLEAMNVRWVGYGPKVKPARGRSLRPLSGRRRLYTVDDPWPMAFWTDDILVVPNTSGVIVWLELQHPAMVVFEEDDIPGDAAQRLPRDVQTPATHGIVPASLAQARRGSMRFEVDAPATGVLAISEAFAPGWTARVDGETAAVWRGNVVMRIVELGAGSHTVLVEYRPPGTRAVWLLWLIGWLAVAGVAVRVLRRRRAR